MKKKIEDRLKELIEEKAKVEQAYHRIIGAIANCQELLKEKESKDVSNEV